MKGDMQAALARGVNYVLGRRRKMRLAAIPAVAATEERIIWKSKGQKATWTAW